MITDKTKKNITIVIMVVIIFIMLLSRIFNKKTELYYRYQYPNEEFYGEELYSEIEYNCTEYELDVGNIVLDKANDVAEYTGTYKDAEMELGDVGALRRYYYFESKDAVEQYADFQLITCKIIGNEGHVWVSSTIIRYDKDGKNAGGGGRDMLSLWNIELRDDEWYVTQVRNTP